MLPLMLHTHAEQVASGQVGYRCFDQAVCVFQTEMACGVHLGILLICLVQAEHVRCLWATQAQSSKRQNGDAYVGFLQQDSGLRRLGGSYPQDQFRQDSISPARSSFNSKTSASGGYNNQRLSSGGYAQTVSQPAQGGHASVRLVQSSSASRPNWRTTNTKEVNAPKHSFGLSTAIASGTSVSKYNENQNGGARAWKAQQGTQRTSQYLPGSSVSGQSPSRERGYDSSSSHQSAAQTPRSAAAKTPARYGQGGFSSSSSLFSAGVPPPLLQYSERMQTSATGPARRVSSQRRSKASKPSSFSSTQNARASYNPSQAEAGNPYQSKLFPAAGGSAQGSYNPTSNRVSYTQSLPAAYKQNAPVGFAPRSVKAPASQRLNYKPSYTSTEQSPSRNLAASGSSRAGTSPQLFAPTRTHDIPHRYGGFAIRRLKDPVDEKEAGVQRPQPYKPQAAPYKPQAAPYKPQAVPYKPQAPSVHQASKWKRIRPGQGHNQVQEDQ
ncbi:secreted protein C-like [Seriola aureovittata]|uniref:secreted protein C-like n=1 Tax=Seriola aureovittata TaxID=2871759 RepID=UPI0024BE3C38|nr:secreted protein C-like [Seriola aureovittata]